MSRVYTVTLNPSLDYIVSVKDFRLGLTNRTSSEKWMPGGKGINVSVVLHNLGVSNTALGFKAGFTGEEIERRLGELGVCTDFIPVEQGFNRINVKVISVDGTEINGAGPVIRTEHIDQLMKKLDVLQTEDVLFLSGSIPPSLSKDIYSDIMKKLKHQGVRIVVDAAGELLCNVLEHRPFLVKPNRQELGELFGTELTNRASAIPYGRKMQEMGAANVLISLGADGAVLLTEDGEVMQSQAPCGKVVNSVGAGDSMLAGFMAEWLDRHDYRQAFYRGIAAGSASAFSDGLCKREAVEALVRGVADL